MKFLRKADSKGIKRFTKKKMSLLTNVVYRLHIVAFCSYSYHEMGVLFNFNIKMKTVAKERTVKHIVFLLYFPFLQI